MVFKGMCHCICIAAVKMKTVNALAIVTVVAVFTATVLAENQEEMMQHLHESCVAETGISESLIDNARKGDFSEDRKLKCYMKCILYQLGSLTEEGQFDAQVIIAVLPPGIVEEASKAYLTCQGERADDVCETAFKVLKCVYKEKPDKFLLV